MNDALLLSLERDAFSLAEEARRRSESIVVEVARQYVQPVEPDRVVEVREGAWWWDWPTPKRGNPTKRGPAKRRPVRGWRGYAEGLARYLEHRHAMGENSPIVPTEAGMSLSHAMEVIEAAEGWTYLARCSRQWLGTETVGLRPHACGDRRVCPMCADYRATVQGQEAAKAMREYVLAAWPKVEGRMECVGAAYELTMHKAISATLETIQREDGERWRKLVNRMRRKAVEVVLSLHPEGDAAIHVSTHLAGESDPANPHLHWHMVLGGVVRVRDSYEFVEGSGVWKEAPPVWRPLRAWVPEVELAAARATWGKAQRRLAKELGVDVEIGDGDIHRSFFGLSKATPERALERMSAYIVYQDRALLKDLWTGAKPNAKYTYTHRVEGVMEVVEMELPTEGFAAAVERVMSLPAGWKRTTWYGPLAETRIAQTMEELGWEREPESEEEEESETVKDEVWYPVRRQRGGIWFRAEADGREVFFPWDKLSLRPKPRAGEKPLVKHRRGWRPKAETEQL